MVKKVSLIIKLLILAINLHGQQENAEMFRIGLRFSPDLCYRTLSNNTSKDSVNAVINNRNEQEVLLLGFTTGLGFDFRFSKQFGIEAGIQYSDKGYRLKFEEHKALQPNDPFIPEKALYEYHFKYLEFPLGINYTRDGERLHFYASGGLISHFLLQADEEVNLIFPGGKTEKRNQPSPYTFNRFMLSAQVSAGIALDIGKRIELRIDPVFRYGLLKINDTLVTANLWSAGLQLACNCRF